MRRHPARLPSVLASYIALCLLLFGPVLLGGRVLFFRDFTYLYYPGYVFLERALDQGVWPLWNPTQGAGVPFAAPIAAWYPLDLALTASGGATGALRFGPPLHVLVAMLGAFRLARVLRFGALAAWAAGAFYGCSGVVLSCVSLLPLLQAAAWAPLVVAALLRLVETPTPRRVAALALVSALQVSTLSGEIVFQTWLLAGLLLPRRPSRRSLAALALAALLALGLLAPILVPLASSLRDTARSQGLDTAAALADAASTGLLLEALLPRFLGDVHTMTERGFWGQAFFPSGFPYFPSLYLGPVVLLLAARSRHTRLLAIALLGVLLALGSHGPLGFVLAAWARVFRAPIKFLFLTTLAASLAAGAGVDAGSWSPARRRGALLLMPGVILLALSAWARLDPAALAAACQWLAPGIGASGVGAVVAGQWPAALLTTGALSLAAAGALLASARLRVLAAVAALCDLVVVNVALNPSAPADFFELRQETRHLLATTAPGPWRLFSVAVDGRALHWSPALLARNRDLPLYALDRQALAPGTPVADRLDGALDEDRTGFAPTGAALTIEERLPQSFSGIVPRLRLANVRYVVSLAPLPEGPVRQVGEAPLAEVAEPLRLYELEDALPRAFFVPDLQAEVPARPEAIEYASPDPHHVTLAARTPPGFIVVLDGYDPRWTVAGVPGPIERWGRYRAVRTPGGTQHIAMSFVQPGLRAALFVALFCVGMVTLLAFRRIALDTSRSKELTFGD